MQDEPNLKDCPSGNNKEPEDIRMTMGPNPVLFESMTPTEMTTLTNLDQNTRIQKEIENILGQQPIHEDSDEGPYQSGVKPQEATGHNQESQKKDPEPIELKEIVSSTPKEQAPIADSFPRVPMDTKAIVAA
jgi:hypothetical protein